MSATRVFALATLVAGLMLPALPVQAQTLTTLYRFKGGSDGVEPVAALLYLDGALYGTTEGGGAADAGTVFKVDPTTGVETVLYSFKGEPDGAVPAAQLTQDAGILYGTTTHCGAAGFGTAFGFNLQTSTETVLHSFAGGTDGEEPAAGLIYLNGTLYGTTVEGGASNNGAIFGVDATTGAETVLYSFNGAEGKAPFAPLIYSGGLFYGTTPEGGQTNGGTVFAFDATTGAETVLHSFVGGPNDGAASYTGLVFHGALYGTTYGGGRSNEGTVFRIDPKTGANKIMHSFFGHHSDGENPEAGLVYVDGTLYGTASGGGTRNFGIVFAIDATTGAETVLHSFAGHDGKSPVAPLIYQDGAFYGITPGGGGDTTACRNGCGTVFKLTP
jgi:uncharacterized repeat protein (TIGR03803 family)